MSVQWESGETCSICGHTAKANEQLAKEGALPYSSTICGLTAVHCSLVWSTQSRADPVSATQWENGETCSTCGHTAKANEQLAKEGALLNKMHRLQPN